LGYGHADSGLKLNLVYNPLGASLPPSQTALQTTYRRELSEHFGIVFNRLFTITNMPIKRFLHQLDLEDRYESYMQTLLEAFNPQAAEGVMCRNLLSVSWDGQLYDNDFNQALELPLDNRRTTVCRTSRHWTRSIRGTSPSETIVTAARPVQASPAVVP